MEGILRSDLTDVGSERRMVGSAGNAPVVIFQRCFVTAGLQTAGWITSLKSDWPAIRSLESDSWEVLLRQAYGVAPTEAELMRLA